MAPRRAGESGFTLMEVLIAFAALGTAYVTVLGLLTQSLTTMDRLTRRFEAELWAEDAYLRYVLREQGYDIEDIHPALRERHEDWEARVEEEPLAADDLPVTVPFPVGWEVTWVNVSVEDELGAVLTSLRPLWARNDESMFDSTDEDVILIEEPVAEGGGRDSEVGPGGRKMRGTSDIGVPDRRRPRPGFRRPGGN